MIFICYHLSIFIYTHVCLYVFLHIHIYIYILFVYKRIYIPTYTYIYIHVYCLLPIWFYELGRDKTLFDEGDNMPKQMPKQTIRPVGFTYGLWSQIRDKCQISAIHIPWCHAPHFLKTNQQIIFQFSASAILAHFDSAGWWSMHTVQQVWLSGQT